MPVKKEPAKNTKPAAKTAAKPEVKKGKGALPAKGKLNAAAGNSAVSDALEAKLLKLGKSRGILTYDDLNKYLPADEFSPEVIDDFDPAPRCKGR